MPTWLAPALFAGLFIAGHYLALRAASGRIGDALGGVVVEGAAAIGLVLLYFARSNDGARMTTAGVAWSIVSGICISGAMLLLLMSMRRGGPVSATGPIVLGGGVTLAALLAPLLFSERFTLRRALGVGLGLVAILILATEKEAPTAASPEASDVAPTP